MLNYPRGLLQWLSRKMRFPMTIFWGRLFLPIPKRRPLVFVLGEPIDPSTFTLQKEGRRDEGGRGEKVAKEIPMAKSEEEFEAEEGREEITEEEKLGKQEVRGEKEVSIDAVREIFEERLKELHEQFRRFYKDEDSPLIVK